MGVIWKHRSKDFVGLLHYCRLALMSVYSAKVGSLQYKEILWWQRDDMGTLMPHQLPAASLAKRRRHNLQTEGMVGMHCTIPVLGCIFSPLWALSPASLRPSWQLCSSTQLSGQQKLPPRKWCLPTCPTNRPDHGSILSYTSWYTFLLS